MRKYFVIFLVLFVNLCFSCVCKAEEISFIQISDIHFSADDIEMHKFLNFFVRFVEKNKPNFVMFLGDNIDKSNEKDIITFMQIIYKIKTPYYIVLGNHDAYKLGGIDKKEYLEIVSVFNRHQKSEDKDFYFKVNKDIFGVVLDVNSNFAPNKHGNITDEQIEWLDNLLEKYSDKLFLIFQHVPLAAPREDYERSLLNSEPYEKMLEKHSNVVLISSGHYHQASIQKNDNGIVHISAPAYRNAPHYCQTVKVIYDKETKPMMKKTQVTVETEKI